MYKTILSCKCYTFISEIVWCLGYYSDYKTTCPPTEPSWNVHFANFAISQTVIDGITWIGTICALCFCLFERDEANIDFYKVSQK